MKIHTSSMVTLGWRFGAGGQPSVEGIEILINIAHLVISQALFDTTLMIGQTDQFTYLCYFHFMKP